MALKEKMAFVSGSRNELQLQITVSDDAGAALDRDAALAAALATVPATILGCNLADEKNPSIVEQSANAIKFQMVYKRPAQNELRRTANIVTRSKKIFHFLSSGNVYGAGGTSLTSTNASLAWKTDRQGKTEEFNSGKALSIEPLQESRTLEYLTTRSFLSDTYLDSMEDLVSRGCFNSDTFFGKAPGTVQIVRFTATERDDDDWEVSYGFGHQTAQTSVDVGDGVQIPTLNPYEYYWCVEKEVYDDGDIQPKVIKAVVGQVWPQASFTPINLPGQ